MRALALLLVLAACGPADTRGAAAFYCPDGSLPGCTSLTGAP